MIQDTDNDVMVVRLDPTSLEDLAHRVAELVGPAAAPPPAERRAGTTEEARMLTAAQVAERWGVDRSWVYDHADQLGARRLGSGKRPRLRFEPAEVAAYLQPTPDRPAAEPAGRRSRPSHRDVRR
jgi:predicted DNA-binding transcriptional regulator AlpA